MKSAEVEVYRGVYYDASNGLLDPRMGPPNKTKSCATCNGDLKECPGHYGYLNLALPVFNVGYLPIIVDILKCICKGCSRILLGEKERLEFLRKMRNTKLEHLRKNELLKRVVKRCTAMTSGRKAVICSRCGCVNGLITSLCLYDYVVDRITESAILPIPSLPFDPCSNSMILNSGFFFAY
nr:DNA-directed RNA polymerase III subunit 1-like isoform X1 [Ipomoea batatas]